MLEVIGPHARVDRTYLSHGHLRRREVPKKRREAASERRNNEMRGACMRTNIRQIVSTHVSSVCKQRVCIVPSLVQPKCFIFFESATRLHQLHSTSDAEQHTQLCPICNCICRIARRQPKAATPRHLTPAALPHTL